MTQWPPSSEIVPHTGTIVPSWETPAVFQNFAPPAQGREAGGGRREWFPREFLPRARGVAPVATSPRSVDHSTAMGGQGSGRPLMESCGCGTRHRASSTFSICRVWE